MSIGPKNVRPRLKVSVKGNVSMSDALFFVGSVFSLSAKDKRAVWSDVKIPRVFKISKTEVMFLKFKLSVPSRYPLLLRPS